MSDLYAEQLEMQLRFAEEECQAREMYAYERGKADGRVKAVDDVIGNIIPTLYENDVDEEVINLCKKLLEQIKDNENE